MGQIVIYVDQGVSGVSLRHTVKSLQKEVCLTKHVIKRMDAEALAKTAWEKETDLLIIPGGQDVLYCEALKGKGTHKIAQFVRDGGAYLGICAGAYFAAQAIEFEKGATFEVCGRRELELYPGVAKGSAYGSNKYSPHAETGVEAALVSWEKKPSFVYFNGGCFFVSPEAYPAVEVIATYSDLKQDPAAIVLCQFGKGKALLSGVHFEFSAPLLNRESPHLQRVLPLLEKGEERRRELMRAMLLKLDISINIF